ncbi:MAG: carboxymuconolactone decarboxylase family protein [Neisseriaceae bacterium]|nr:carboxymuconolactone decarboxylase family protein [Neisseriaceae bacterium]MBP6862303.1 carboxymuconolactone decarboxylase family protein [Neisseriaceae bacterium]
MSTLRLPYPKLSAAAYQGLGTAHAALAKSPLGPLLLELVYLRVSQINGCAYCLGLHTQSLRDQGESQKRLDVLSAWRHSSAFSERERAALTWAESMTELGPVGGGSDAEYDALRAHFSDVEISDLTLAVALMNAYNRMAIGMRQLG